MIADTQFIAQARGIRLYAQKRIRAGFNHKAVMALRLYHTAQAVRFFKQHPLQVRAGAPRFLQIKSRAQTRDAASDDGYALHASDTIPEASASRVDASLAIAAMNVGEVFSDSGRHILSFCSLANWRKSISIS